jgi:hypothetical protein
MGDEIFTGKSRFWHGEEQVSCSGRRFEPRTETKHKLRNESETKEQSVHNSKQLRETNPKPESETISNVCLNNHLSTSGPNLSRQFDPYTPSYEDQSAYDITAQN